MRSEQEKNERFAALEKIRKDVVALKKGALVELRRKENYVPVIGEGSAFSKIMFVGEAPGKNEAKSGRPFVGASGKFLNELLESVGIKREDVYITNIVKDRPPENRDPTPSEIELYAPFLDAQIDIIKPKVIATLGRFSMNYVMSRLGLISEIEPISKAHGKSYEATTSYGTVRIVPQYHPAVALYNGSMRDVLKKDFEIMKKFIK
jgi:uracil-DNA glycosylase